MNSSKYFEFDSTHRNRKLYPNPSNFSISLNTQSTNYQTALDPVALTAPIFAWTSNLFDIAGALGVNTSVNSFNITGTVEANSILNPIQYTDDNFLLVLNAGTGNDSSGKSYQFKFQQLENYYTGACVVITNSSGLSLTRRISYYQYTGTCKNGLNGPVYSISLSNFGGFPIYIGGNFSNFGNIAVWNSSNWVSLGGGTNGIVKAIALDSSGNVYIGGAFTSVGTGAGVVAVNNIAMWNVSTLSWSAVGDGVDGPVNALVSDNGMDMYVGGSFTNANAYGIYTSVTVNNVAYWNGVTWSYLGIPSDIGLNGPVNVLAYNYYSGNLYVGGSFSSTYSGTTQFNNIAYWNSGTGWNEMGSNNGGFAGTGGVSGPVYALELSFDISSFSLTIGGNFTNATAYSTSPPLPPAILNNVAVYSGTTFDVWYPISGIGGIGFNGPVYAIAGGIYGGSFTEAGGVSVNNLATIGFSGLGPYGNGVNGAVFSLANYNPNSPVYAGGNFTYDGTGTVNLNYIADISSTSNSKFWYSLGSYDRCIIKVKDPFNDVLQINSQSYTFCISDPTDLSDTNFPLIFVPAGLPQDNAYIDYYLFDENQYNGVQVSFYNGTTRMLELNVKNNPITGWLARDNFSLRKQIPVLPEAAFDALGLNTLTTMYFLPNQFSPSYVNNWLRLAPINYYFLNGPYTTPTLSVNNNGYAQIVQVLKVESGVFPPFGNAYKVTITPLTYIVNQGIAEILAFSYDNVSPYVFNGSSAPCVYQMELINLVLPNIILNSGAGGRIAFYPYLYVIIYNVEVSSSGVKNLMLSNNPNSTSAIFRCPVNDIHHHIDSPFIKLDGNRMSQFFNFSPYGTISFQILLPNGDPFETVIQDFFSPVEPNYRVQISASFRFTKYEQPKPKPVTVIGKVEENIIQTPTPTTNPFSINNVNINNNINCITTYTRSMNLT